MAIRAYTHRARQAAVAGYPHLCAPILWTNTNVYVVNSRVAWQSARGARFASFNAQIVVDEQEQQRTIEELEVEGAELHEVPIMEISDDGTEARQSCTLDVPMTEKKDSVSQGTLPL